MKEPNLPDELDAQLKLWAEHRRAATTASSADLTSSVMQRLRTEQDQGNRPAQPSPRFLRIALTAACAIAGVGKILIVIRLSI